MKNRGNKQAVIGRRRFIQYTTGMLFSGIGAPLLAQTATAENFDVYKEPTCGCCVNWIDNIQQHGYTSTVHHPRDLNEIKHELGVIPAWQSCHTAVNKDGFVFEGHVPARYISQFLAAPPANSLGLAVPGMPLGSPGMEMGDRFNPYDVVLMNKDGSASVFASVKSPADQ